MTTAVNIVETMICARAVSDLLARGFEIAVDDGDSRTMPLSDRNAVLRAMFTTDDDRLYVYRSKRSIGWVQLVYGNGGFDVISDYTTNLEKYLAGANALSDRMGEKPTDWLLDLLSIADALKLAAECVGYCRRAHADAQSGSGFPVETLLDAAMAKAAAL